MKLIKMLGIAMVLAIASTALIGAGTASAKTKQCFAKPVVTEFPEGSGKFVLACPKVKVEEKEQSSGLKGKVFKKGKNTGVATFVTSAGNVECEKTELESEDETVEEEKKIKGEVTNLVFSGCTDTVMGCTVAAEIKSSTPFPLEGEYTSTETPEGTLTLVEPKTSFNFGICGTCTYGGNAGEKVTGTWENAATEAAESQFIVTEAVVEKSGGPEFCPAEAKETLQQQMKLKKGTSQAGQTVEQTNVFFAQIQL